MKPSLWMSLILLQVFYQIARFRRHTSMIHTALANQHSLYGSCYDLLIWVLIKNKMYNSSVPEVIQVVEPYMNPVCHYLPKKGWVYDDLFIVKISIRFVYAINCNFKWYWLVDLLKKLQYVILTLLTQAVDEFSRSPGYGWIQQWIILVVIRIKKD